MSNQTITISLPKAFAQTGTAGTTGTNPGTTGTNPGTTGTQPASDQLHVGVPIKPGTTVYTNSEHNRIYQQYMTDLYSFAVNLGTSLAILMIVYAGYKYMISQGNSSALNDAKEIFTGALLGLAILLLIKVILNFLALPDVTS